MKTPAYQKTEAKTAKRNGGWLRRCVGRLTWQRELARAKSKLLITELRLKDAQNDARVYFECYSNNLQYCSELEQENGLLKDRLRQQKKYLVAANRGAQRNASVAQLMAARSAIRDLQSPNDKSSHTAGGKE